MYIKYTNKYIKKIFFDYDNSLRLQSVIDNNIEHTEDNLVHTFCADAFTIVLHKSIEEDRPPVRVYPYNIYEAIRGGSSYYSDRHIF